MNARDADRGPQECYIGGCHNEATRELHFPSLDIWKPYCDSCTPLEPSDDERALEGKIDG